MEMIPPRLARSGEQEPDSEVHHSIRCSKEWVLRSVGRLHVELPCRRFDRRMAVRTSSDGDDFSGVR